MKVGGAVSVGDLVEGADAAVEVFQQSCRDVVNPAVDSEFSVVRPGVLDDGGVADVHHLLEDIELYEPLGLQSRVCERGQSLLFAEGDVADVAEPVVDEAELGVFEGGGDAAAAVVATDDDMFDLEVVDGVLEDREAVEVGVGEEVGDVAVDKDFAGGEAENFVGRDPAVGAADPEIFGGLLDSQLLKSFWVEPGGPLSVIFEKIFYFTHWASSGGNVFLHPSGKGERDFLVPMWIR